MKPNLIIPKIIKVILIIQVIINSIVDTKLNNSIIYILIWETYYIGLTSYLDKEEGQQYFIKKKCHYQNCFLTRNKTYFSDVRDYDVIMFNAMTFNDPNLSLPDKRSIHQKYVFMSDETPAIHPVPTHFNNVFNITWTYKLDSDAYFRYVIVKNKNGKVIGPNVNIKWVAIEDMAPVDEQLKRRLDIKNKAAIWVASHCETPSQREVYVKSLKEELGKYNLVVDTFGHCGVDSIDVECAKGIKECDKLIEMEYYFYLAFENSMSEDYVTEKLLTAIKHYAVPVVYGGANYNRFMPNGSYLDAQALGPQNLARIMNDTIHYKETYYNFFKWRKHYSLHDPYESPDTDEICAFCAFLNKNRFDYKRTIYKNITRFWMA